jgi:hypothetical protein
MALGMTAAFLVQLLVSALAIAGLVALAAWLGVPRATGAMDEGAAREVLAEELPDRAIGKLWLAPNGRGAIAVEGGEALIVRRVGDGHVVEVQPLSSLSAPRRSGKDDPAGWLPETLAL